MRYFSSSAPLYYEGQEIALFSFLPNYRKDYIEKFEWKTNVLTSFNNKEQRIRLRNHPRRSVEFEVFALGNDKAALENVMWQSPLDLYAVPDWNNGTQLYSRDIEDVTYTDSIAISDISDTGGSVVTLLNGIYGLTGMGGLVQTDADLPDPGASVFNDPDLVKLPHEIFGLSGFGGAPMQVIAESYSSQVAPYTLDSNDVARHPVLGLSGFGGAVQIPSGYIASGAVSSEYVYNQTFFKLGDMSHQPYVKGGYLVAFLSTNEFQLHKVAKVLAQGVVTETPFTGNRSVVTIFPAMLGRLNPQQSFTRATGNFLYGTVTFNMLQAQSAYENQSVPLPEYLGYSVLENTFNWDGGVQTEWNFEAKLIDNETNNPAVYVTSEVPVTTSQMSWFLNGRPAIAAYLNLLYAVAGQLRPFWLPSESADMYITNVVGNVITIKDSGYTDFVNLHPSRCHIRVAAKSGQIMYRKILAASSDHSGSENLVLDLPLEISANMVKMVSFMNLARLGQDRIELAYTGSKFAKSQVSIRTLKHDL